MKQNARNRKPLVEYYDEGWRVGYLVERGTKWATIERILPLGAKPTKRGRNRPTIKVLLEDMREVVTPLLP